MGAHVDKIEIFRHVAFLRCYDYEYALAWCRSGVFLQVCNHRLCDTVCNGGDFSMSKTLSEENKRRVKSKCSLSRVSVELKWSIKV